MYLTSGFVIFLFLSLIVLNKYRLICYLFFCGAVVGQSVSKESSKEI
jgi:hypothetical protein